MHKLTVTIWFNELVAEASKDTYLLFIYIHIIRSCACPFIELIQYTGVSKQRLIVSAVGFALTHASTE